MANEAYCDVGNATATNCSRQRRPLGKKAHIIFQNHTDFAFLSLEIRPSREMRIWMLNQENRVVSLWPFLGLCCTMKT